MKFCQDHWDRLRAAIEDRGLGHLIAPSGQIAGEQLVDQIKRAAAGDEPTTPVNYDPLMSAHWAIVNNVGQLASGALLHLMSSDECPLCWANKENPYGYDYDVWIDRAADDQVQVVAAMKESK